MAEKRAAFIHWSKNGQSGGGKAEFSLGDEPCDFCIPINPIQGARLWLDLSPAPALIDLHSVAVLGADRLVLRCLSEPADLRRSLSTGASAWWAGAEGARLMSLGERSILSIDIPESGPPAHAVQIRLGFVEAAGAASLADAMGQLLDEAKREHEEFAKQLDTLLSWQREQIKRRDKQARFPAGWPERLGRPVRLS